MLKVLVIGSGMYVAGRGTEGFGTVLPALYEAARHHLVDEIHVVSTKAKSVNDVKKRSKKLASVMGIKVPLSTSPKRGQDATASAKAIDSKAFDCAIVVVPDHLHAEVGKDVLKGGLHTLMVKPLAPGVKEAKELNRLAQQKKLYGAVEFHKRHDEANLKMRDLIAEGTLGDICYIHVGYSQRKVIPLVTFKNWIAHTNIFQYLGVHYVDLIHFLSKATPVRVMATGQKFWLTNKGINAYDAIQAFIEWRRPNGKKFSSTILTNWIDPDHSTAMSDQKISIVGTKGRVDSDQKNRGVQIVTDERGVEDFNPYFSQLYGNDDGGKTFQGYGEKSIRQFLEDVWALRQGMISPKDLEGKRPTFKEGLISTAVIEAVQKSLAKNSQWISCAIN